MPSGPARKATAPIALALLALVLLALAWRYLAPYYNSIIVALARPLGPATVSLQAEGLEITLRYAPMAAGGSPWFRVHGLTFHAGLLLVTALILATPACPWRRRAAGLAAAWPGFSAVNIGSVVLLSWGLDRSVAGGLLTLAGIAPFMPLAYLGLPALAGAAWCLKFWLPALSSGISAQPLLRLKGARLKR